jgi:hypothetical protein
MDELSHLFVNSCSRGMLTGSSSKTVQLPVQPLIRIPPECNICGDTEEVISRHL